MSGKFVQYFPPDKTSTSRVDTWVRREYDVDDEGLLAPAGEAIEYKLFTEGERILSDMARDTSISAARATLEVMFGCMLVDGTDINGLRSLAKAVEILREMEHDAWGR